MMAYFDGLDDQPLTPDAEAENRRKMLGMLASTGKAPVLGQPLQPVQPNAPTPRLTPAAPPSLNTPPIVPSMSPLGRQPAPVRPNVAPTREDFPAKPEVSGWKKVLGLGLSALAGPQAAGPLAERILHGQRNEAERKYGQAEQEWERGQSDEVRQAQIRNINSEIQARENKPDAQDTDRAKTVTIGDQVKQWNPATQRYDILVGPAKTADKPDTATQEDQRYEGIKSSQLLKKPISPEDSAWAQAYEKRKTLAPFATAVAQAPQKSTERSDKSFQYNNSAVDKIATPVDQINQRMGRLMDTLNQNTPQADALVAPELLSVMSGGQGSGLRMNEAEISRIVGGRSKWESLKASINKWKTDPNAALSITPDQRAQIRSLAKTVQDKLIAKGKIIDDSRNSLIDSDDPKEHRRIVSEMKKRLDTIDAGESEGGPIELERGADGKLRPKNARQ